MEAIRRLDVFHAPGVKDDIDFDVDIVLAATPYDDNDCDRETDCELESELNRPGSHIIYLRKYRRP
jgi:hypothetical protein